LVVIQASDAAHAAELMSVMAAAIAMARRKLLNIVFMVSTSWRVMLPSVSTIRANGVVG
jgi:hypothetical protein